MAGAVGLVFAAAAGGAFTGPPGGHARLFTGRWFHAPVADDDCSVCHTMHRDPVGASLQAPVPELCYQCHEDVAAKDQVHEPVGEGRCTDCHHIHTSDEKSLLIRRVPELCIECHPLNKRHVARNTLCTSCHGVHSSETASFLKGERTLDCNQCHADKRQGGSLHAPAREGKCLVCHFTHRDPRFEAVGFRAPYPKTMRVRLAPETYALCAECHEERLYTDPEYLGTRFRTATRNLHARHVGAESGVACSACHDLHAARRSALIVEWLRLPDRPQRPLQFLHMSNGGSCSPACHGAAAYLHDKAAPLGEENGR